MSGIISTKIVTDGLVLYVDSVNPNSYVSGSTNWVNLIVGPNGQLTNGVIFSPENNNSLSFDGVDDYITLGVIGGNLITKPISVSTWVKFNTLNSFAGIVCKDSVGSFQFALRLGIGGNVDRINLLTDGDNSPQLYSNPIQIDTWYNVVATCDTDDRRLYINGVLEASSIATSNFNFVSDTLNFGSDYDYTRLLNGYMNSVMIHNRVLSQEEVSQNYNKLKIRFK